jgi:EAL domain-containing protein (putative c-di-GMP-specific phosphodiesterase class I)
MYLKRMPVSALKIDRMFVDDVCTDAPAARIVEATIALAGALDMVSIAEGVEDRDTLARLCALRCRVAQGYFLARPMPSGQLETWLSQGRRVAALDELIEGDGGSGLHDTGA